MPNRNLQHPDITYIEQNGEPPTYYTDKPPEPLECAICGEAISEEQSAYNLCSRCEKKSLARFKYYLCNEFTDNERAYLDTCVEGNSLTEVEKIKDIHAIYMGKAVRRAKWLN